MQNLNKKALSEIVANILMILLSITLIALVSSSIFSLVKNPNLSPGTSCPIIQFNQPIKIDSVCYNEEKQEVELTLSRNSDEKIKIESLKFIISDNSASESFSCSSSCGNCEILNNGEKKTYYINTLNNKKASLIANNCILEEKEIIKC